jgi:hypothetical protein
MLRPQNEYFKMGISARRGVEMLAVPLFLLVTTILVAVVMCFYPWRGEL